MKNNFKFISELIKLRLSHIMTFQLGFFAPWSDIPGQFKVFIDRCTPWCDTHDPHAKIKSGKKGYTIALRTGPSMRECNRIIESIEHFYGHLGIVPSGSLGLCSVEYKEAVADRISEIEEFCNRI